MSLYLISQILVVIGFTIDMVGRTMKKKKFILMFTIVSSAFFVASYICLKSPISAIANGVNLIKNFWYSILDSKNKSFKSYIFPMCLIMTSFITCVIIFWQNAFDLFVIGSILIQTVSFAFKNTAIIRCALMLNGCLWFIYNFTLSAYANMASDTIAFIITFVSLIIYNIIPYVKNKKNNKNGMENIKAEIISEKKTSLS